LAIGQEATTAAGTTVTVYAYEQPAVSDNRFIQPDPGNEYAIADVGGCASPSATKTSYFSSGFFELQMPDHTRRQNTISVREPALHTANLSAGDCLRGWLTFQVPIGTRPKFIIASDFINAGSSLKWIP
jgi:hypothetical protein